MTSVFSQDLITELHTACRDNNISTVKRIIDQNPDIINVAIDPSRSGYTALTVCSVHGNSAIIEYLASRPNINFNTTSTSGMTALHYAASCGQLKATEALLKTNININHGDNAKYTALHKAAWFGRFEVVKALLNDPRIDPELLSSLNKTAIDVTCEYGSADQSLAPKIKEMIQTKIDERRKATTLPAFPPPAPTVPATVPVISPPRPPAGSEQEEMKRKYEAVLKEKNELSNQVTSMTREMALLKEQLLKEEAKNMTLQQRLTEREKELGIAKHPVVFLHVNHRDEKGDFIRDRLNPLADELRTQGYPSIFDPSPEQMRTLSPANTSAIIICLTTNYMRTINAHLPDEPNFESYDLASIRMSNQIISLIMEASLGAKSNWSEGKLKEELSTSSLLDYSNLGRDHENRLRQVKVSEDIVKRIQSFSS